MLPGLIKVISLLWLLSSVLPVNAQAEEILSWEDCVREAKKNNPDLISAQEGINQAEANKAITRSDILPSISGGLDIETSDATDRDRTDRYFYGLTARQLLFDGFKTSYDIRAAIENIRSARYNYEVVSSELRFRLRTAFVGFVRAQELLGITEDIVQRRKQNAELVRLRYEAGREHRGSLLTAQANLAQAEFDLAQARRNIELVRRRLIKELGWTVYTPVSVKGDLAISYNYKEKGDFAELAEGNPLLREQIARKEAARNHLQSAKRDLFPKVFANAGVGRTDSDWPPHEDEWSAGVSLSFPLFEGGRRRAEVSRATAVLSQSQADERSVRDDVFLKLEEAWTGLLDLIDLVEVRQKFFEATRERAKIARAQYASGLISFDNWTIIEDDLVREQKAYLEARTDALRAEASWVRAEGKGLEHD